jgi:hypothetical protein
VILGIHVGRQLLGFQDQPDRKALLRAEMPQTSPWQKVAVYESLLNEVPQADPLRQRELLGYDGLLWRHLPAYTFNAAEVHGRTWQDVLLETFPRCLELAKQAHEMVRKEAYAWLMYHTDPDLFDWYVDALIEAGRQAEIAPIIKLFAPHWDQPGGYLKLGRAAFLIGDLHMAETCLTKFRDEYEDFFVFPEIAHLAEIWHGRGDVDKARALLVECMQQLKEAIDQSQTHSDRDFYTEVYGSHRDTYLRLCPAGHAELARLDLPAAP